MQSSGKFPMFALATQSGRERTVGESLVTERAASIQVVVWMFVAE